jgi:dTDP-4-amino-4,6-dideoxygalactose transaminase
MYYVLCQSLAERTRLIARLKEQEIMAVFHYLSLHLSPFYHDKHDGRDLALSDAYTDRLLRLPLFFELTDAEQDKIIQTITGFFGE